MLEKINIKIRRQKDLKEIDDLQKKIGSMKEIAESSSFDIDFLELREAERSLTSAKNVAKVDESRTSPMQRRRVINQHMGAAERIINKQRKQIDKLEKQRKEQEESKLNAQNTAENLLYTTNPYIEGAKSFYDQAKEEFSRIGSIEKKALYEPLKKSEYFNLVDQGNQLETFDESLGTEKLEEINQTLTETKNRYEAHKITGVGSLTYVYGEILYTIGACLEKVSDLQKTIPDFFDESLSAQLEKLKEDAESQMVLNIESIQNSFFSFIKELTEKLDKLDECLNTEHQIEDKSMLDLIQLKGNLIVWRPLLLKDRLVKMESLLTEVDEAIHNKGESLKETLGQLIYLKEEGVSLKDEINSVVKEILSLEGSKSIEALQEKTKDRVYAINLLKQTDDTLDLLYNQFQSNHALTMACDEKNEYQWSFKDLFEAIKSTVSEGVEPEKEISHLAALVQKSEALRKRSQLGEQLKEQHHKIQAYLKQIKILSWLSFEVKNIFKPCKKELLVYEQQRTELIQDFKEGREITAEQVVMISRNLNPLLSFNEAIENKKNVIISVFDKKQSIMDARIETIQAALSHHSARISKEDRDNYINFLKEARYSLESIQLLGEEGELNVDAILELHQLNKEIQEKAERCIRDLKELHQEQRSRYHQKHAKIHEFLEPNSPLITMKQVGESVLDEIDTVLMGRILEKTKVPNPFDDDEIESISNNPFDKVFAVQDDQAIGEAITLSKEDSKIIKALDFFENFQEERNLYNQQYVKELKKVFNPGELKKQFMQFLDGREEELALLHHWSATETFDALAVLEKIGMRHEVSTNHIYAFQIIKARVLALQGQIVDLLNEDQGRAVKEKISSSDIHKRLSDKLRRLQDEQEKAQNALIKPFKSWFSKTEKKIDAIKECLDVIQRDPVASTTIYDAMLVLKNSRAIRRSRSLLGIGRVESKDIVNAFVAQLEAEIHKTGNVALTEELSIDINEAKENIVQKYVDPFKRKVNSLPDELKTHLLELPERSSNPFDHDVLEEERQNIHDLNETYNQISKEIRGFQSDIEDFISEGKGLLITEGYQVLLFQVDQFNHAFEEIEKRVIAKTQVELDDHFEMAKQLTNDDKPTPAEQEKIQKMSRKEHATVIEKIENGSQRISIKTSGEFKEIKKSTNEQFRTVSNRIQDFKEEVMYAGGSIVSAAKEIGSAVEEVFTPKGTRKNGFYKDVLAKEERIWLKENAEWLRDVVRETIFGDTEFSFMRQALEYCDTFYSEQLSFLVAEGRAIKNSKAAVALQRKYEACQFFIQDSLMDIDPEKMDRMMDEAIAARVQELKKLRQRLDEEKTTALLTDPKFYVRYFFKKPVARNGKSLEEMMSCVPAFDRKKMAELPLFSSIRWSEVPVLKTMLPTRGMSYFFVNHNHMLGASYLSHEAEKKNMRTLKKGLEEKTVVESALTFLREKGEDFTKEHGEGIMYRISELPDIIFHSFHTPFFALNNKEDYEAPADSIKKAFEERLEKLALHREERVWLLEHYEVFYEAVWSKVFSNNPASFMHQAKTYNKGFYYEQISLLKASGLDADSKVVGNLRKGYEYCEAFIDDVFLKASIESVGEMINDAMLARIKDVKALGELRTSEGERYMMEVKFYAPCFYEMKLEGGESLKDVMSKVGPSKKDRKREKDFFSTIFKGDGSIFEKIKSVVEGNKMSDYFEKHNHVLIQQEAYREKEEQFKESVQNAGIDIALYQ